MQEALQRELEKTVCILVTEGLPNCPSRELFHNSQWIRTASHVNEAIHTSQTGEKGIWLYFLLTQKVKNNELIYQKTEPVVYDGQKCHNYSP